MSGTTPVDISRLRTAIDHAKALLDVVLPHDIDQLPQLEEKVLKLADAHESAYREAVIVVQRFGEWWFERIRRLVEKLQNSGCFDHSRGGQFLNIAFPREVAHALRLVNFAHAPAVQQAETAIKNIESEHERALTERLDAYGKILHDLQLEVSNSLAKLTNLSEKTRFGARYQDLLRRLSNEKCDDDLLRHLRKLKDDIEHHHVRTLREQQAIFRVKKYFF